MTDPLDARTDLAGRMAREAGAFAHGYFRRWRELAVEDKGPPDVVSEADRLTEDLKLGHLREVFPDDAVVGEETGGEEARDFWLVDPIDGTNNFVRGISYYCVSVAYVAAGEIEIGAVYDPVQGELFLGRRGQGATCNGRPMRCSDAARVSDALFCIGHTQRLPAPPFLGLLGRIVTGGGAIRDMGAGALMLAHVADGRFDAYLEGHMLAYDAAAGLLLCREAGCKTAPYPDGGRYAQGGAVIATAPGLWPALATS